MTAVLAGLTRNDLLLLKAALLRGEGMRAAYDAWRRDFDIETTSYGQQRLLPLLHRNLLRLGMSDPILSRLRGIRHYHWAQNQLHLHFVMPVIAELRAAGIPVMALKGAALLASCLQDSSLRPMNDLDFMVPRAQVGPAVEILAGRGYRPVGIPLWAVGEVIARYKPGTEFADRADRRIDLHWQVLHHDRRDNADAAFWREAQAMRLAGVELYVPALPHQLLHAVVHAAEWNPVSPLRWCADAVMILDVAGGSFDWDLLVREAVDRRLAWPVFDALRLLAREFDTDVPETVLRSLRRGASRVDEIEFACRRTVPGERSPWARALLALCDIRRSRDDLLRAWFARSIGPFLASQYHSSTVLRNACLLLFWALDRPPSLRRRFHVDRRVRSVALDRLPPLDRGVDVDSNSPTHSAFLDGWSYPELTGRWTDGSEARLAWRLSTDGTRALEVEIEATFFAPPDQPGPSVEIWGNDHLLCVWQRSGAPGARQSLTLAIPAQALRRRAKLVITFAIRGAISPYRAGVSADTRELGIHLHRVYFRTATLAQPANVAEPGHQQSAAAAITPAKLPA